MHNYYFQDKYNDKYLQFIMSDRVVNCLLAAMERQDWFTYLLTSDFVRKHFGTSAVAMTAQFFQDAYPAIRERFGKDQELAIELKFKNPRFFFGLTDSDIAFSSQLNLGLKLEDGMNYLIYDELDFYTEFDMTIEQEEIFGNINEMRWTKGGSNPDRDVPVWNDIDITAEEYSQFW